MRQLSAASGIIRRVESLATSQSHTAPSMVLGQAAGTAAAMLARDELAVEDLQRSLKEQGAFLG